MKRLLFWILALLILIGAAGYLLLTQAPGTVIALTQWQAARSAGLTGRTVMVDGYQTHYFEGGAGPVLVMLHGLGDSRHSFVETAGDLTDDYRVILPDLVGHGDNAMNTARDHSIAGQTTFLRGFFDALGLDTALLAGNSMGGHIAAAFALDTPEKVSKLILIDAAGLVVNDAETYDAVGDPLTSVATFDDLMARIVHNPPLLPLPIKQHLIVEFNARLEFVNAVAAQIRDGKDHDLSDRIRDMEVPTLVLWGEEDVIIPFAVAEAYAERIAGTRLTTLPDAGHAPQREAPKRVAAAILEFLRQTP